MTFHCAQIVIKARKPHRCDLCGTMIAKGDSYLKIAGSNGDFYSYRNHHECEDAAQAYWNEFLDHYDDWPCLSYLDRKDHAWMRDKFPVVAARLGWCATCEGDREVDERLGGISTSGMSPCPDCTP